MIDRPETHRARCRTPFKRVAAIDPQPQPLPTFEDGLLRRADQASLRFCNTRTVEAALFNV